MRTKVMSMDDRKYPLRIPKTQKDPGVKSQLAAKAPYYICAAVQSQTQKNKCVKQSKKKRTSFKQMINTQLSNFLSLLCFYSTSFCWSTYTF